MGRNWFCSRTIRYHERSRYAKEGSIPSSFVDIVLCRDSDDVVECRDSKAFDVGVPLLDIENGGEDSLRDVLVERNDGILYDPSLSLLTCFRTARFTRDMDTTDELDNPITDGLRIIFAFNPVTNDLKYHGPTRNPDKIIDFDSLCTSAFFIRSLNFD